MARIDDVKVNTSIDIDIDFCCKSCGYSFHNSDIDISKSRNGDISINIDPCPQCMGGKDDEIKSLQEEIATLADEKNGYLP